MTSLAPETIKVSSLFRNRIDVLFEKNKKVEGGFFLPPFDSISQ
jgi:hypothetical protein